MGDFPHTFTADDCSRGGQQRAAKIREKREAAEALVVERLAEKLERATGVVGEALDADAAIPTKDGVVYEPDHSIRLRAAFRTFDQVLGTPRQSMEHTGPDGGPVQLEHRARLTLGDLGAYAEVEPGDGSGAGPGG